QRSSRHSTAGRRVVRPDNMRAVLSASGWVWPVLLKRVSENPSPRPPLRFGEGEQDNPSPRCFAGEGSSSSPPLRFGEGDRGGLSDSLSRESKRLRRQEMATPRRGKHPHAQPRSQQAAPEEAGNARFPARDFSFVI